MEYVITILVGISSFLFGLFVKDYFPSYMKKKAENLATKEDIAEITRRTEDVKFKYDFYFKQYSELYCNLYAIIVQSEYVRYFINITEGDYYSFEEQPFIEISQIHKTTTNGNDVSMEEIETSISRFNRKELCEYIISKGQYASQDLLKTAVSYRFARDICEGLSRTDISEEEEKTLIKKMVQIIVKEYNCLRKELKMSYDKSEIEDGIFEYNKL